MHYVIAVCDDEEDVGYLEKAFYSQPGNFSFTSVPSGASLMKLLAGRNHSEFPFLIVIAQYLSDIDSLELVNQLKSNTDYKLIPVSIMSGFASNEVITKYYLAGANCFYRRPLDLSDWNHMADCLVTLFLTGHNAHGR